MKQFFKLIIIVFSLNYYSFNAIGSNILESADSIIDTKNTFTYFSHSNSKTSKNSLNSFLTNLTLNFVEWLSQPFRPVWGWYQEGDNRISECKYPIYRSGIKLVFQSC